jgi:hypothetical protein
VVAIPPTASAIIIVVVVVVIVVVVVVVAVIVFLIVTVDVRRRGRKRLHDNQSGRTRGEREVESPAWHEAAAIERRGREDRRWRRRVKMQHSNKPVQRGG